MLLCIELRGNQLAVLWPMVVRALVGGIDIVDAGAKGGFNPTQRKAVGALDWRPVYEDSKIKYVEPFFDEATLMK